MYIDKSAVGVTGAGIHVPSEIKTLKHVFANDKRYRIIYGHFALYFFTITFVQVSLTFKLKY